MKLNIEHQTETFQFNLKGTKQLLTKLLNQEYKGGVDTLNIIFCNDNFLLDINTRFLNHNYFTDIITFCLSEVNEDLYAELYVSIERVQENAKQRHISEENELKRVIIHGVLHLCGFQDGSQQQKQQMRLKEDEYLELW